MAKSPRFLTFAPGEREAEIFRLSQRGRDRASIPSPIVEAVDTADTDDAFEMAASSPAIPTPTRRGSKLVKAHSVAVTYPDGTVGPCLYERLGPSFHRFEYRYGDNALLARTYRASALENTIPAIEQAAKHKAADAFMDAIETERKDRFCRITEPSDGSRVKDPSRYQMCAKAAKEQAGKYAVCQRIGAGSRLLPVSTLLDTIEEANDAWGQTGNPAYVVACCNRLDRCWDVPKYNPMPAAAREIEKEEESDAAG